MNFSEADILNQTTAFAIPLLRISALLVAMPLFSIRAVSVRVRLVLAVALTLAIMPGLPALPDVELFSYPGFMLAVQQVMIGLLIGFILQLVFGAVVFAGQGVALSMGLGFSVMVDPQNGQQVPVISQFYLMTAMLIFLSMNAHLLLFKMLLDSFNTLPAATTGLEKTDLWTLIAWSARMIAGGLLLALPLIAALLFVNISFGVAARAAPQLQVFSIGFPVSLMLGLGMLWLTLPDTLQAFSGLLTGAYELIENLLRL